MVGGDKVALQQWITSTCRDRFLSCGRVCGALYGAAQEQVRSSRFELTDDHHGAQQLLKFRITQYGGMASCEVFGRPIIGAASRFR